MKSSATNSVIIVTFVFSLHLTIGSKGVYPFTGLDYPDMASSHNHKRWPRKVHACAARGQVVGLS